MIKELKELKDKIAEEERVTRQHIHTALILIAGAGADKESEIRELVSGTLSVEDTNKVIKDLNSY